jgi:hypothetical protein
MGDLEAEQEKASGLAVSLEVAQREMEGAVNAKEVAEARAKQLQVQLGRANDATASLTQQLGTLKDVVQVRGLEGLMGAVERGGGQVMNTGFKGRAG